MNLDLITSFDPTTQKSTYLIENIYFTSIESGIIQLIFHTLCTDLTFNKPNIKSINDELVERLNYYCKFDFSLSHTETDVRDEFIITFQNGTKTVELNRNKI